MVGLKFYLMEWLDVGNNGLKSDYGRIEISSSSLIASTTFWLKSDYGRIEICSDTFWSGVASLR